jgi:hypothetical protein
MSLSGSYIIIRARRCSATYLLYFTEPSMMRYNVSAGLNLSNLRWRT